MRGGAALTSNSSAAPPPPELGNHTAATAQRQDRGMSCSWPYLAVCRRASRWLHFALDVDGEYGSVGAVTEGVAACAVDLGDDMCAECVSRRRGVHHGHGGVDLVLAKRGEWETKRESVLQPCAVSAWMTASGSDRGDVAGGIDDFGASLLRRDGVGHIAAACTHARLAATMTAAAGRRDWLDTGLSYSVVSILSPGTAAVVPLTS